LEAKVQGLEESSAKVVSFQQIIMALNALSKVDPHLWVSRGSYYYRKNRYPQLFI